MNKKARPQYGGTEILTSLLYLCAMSAALMHVLCRTKEIPCTIIMTAVSFGIYMLFFALRKKRVFAVISFAALALAAGIVMSIVLSRPNAARFMDFIFKASETFSVPFAAAAIFLFSCIMGFTVCYFSTYLPRPSFLLMPSLIPLILSARTAGGLPAGLIIFLAVSYGLACLGSARPEFPSDAVYIDEKRSRAERLISIGVFGVLAALILVVTPRSDQTPMGDYLDKVFDKRGSFYGTNALSNFTQSSGVNHGANDPAENVLFYATTRYPANVSRWAFDKYNGEKGWTSHPDLTTGWKGWQSDKERLSTNALAETLRQAAAEGKLEKYADELLALDPIRNASQKAIMTIRVADGSNTRVVLHPNNTTAVSITGYNKDVFRTRKDELFTDTNFGRNASYYIEYLVEKPNEKFISLLSRVNFAAFLKDARDEKVIDTATMDAFLNERNEALTYLSLTAEYEISPEIKALAESITAGLSSDYEKVLAIENWFGKAGFVYDLDFVPEEATADYFLFKSKRGICSDFATATTLLSRAAGIPTRYVEGFVMSADSRDEYGRYAVKSSDAHAYSMSYIDGYGWIEIDGTKYAALASDGEEFKNTTLVILIVLAIILILSIIFRRQLSEAVFAASLAFRKNDGKIRAVYKRTRRLSCAISGAGAECTTAGEVKDVIARSLGLYKEAAEITESADMLFYGKKSPELPPKRLYKDYRAILKMKKKMKK